MLSLKEKMLAKEAKQPTQMWSSLLLTHPLIEILTPNSSIDLHVYTYSYVEIYISTLTYTNILSNITFLQSPHNWIRHLLKQRSVMTLGISSSTKRVFDFVISEHTKSILKWHMFTASPKQETIENVTKMMGAWREWNSHSYLVIWPRALLSSAK